MKVLWNIISYMVMILALLWTFASPVAAAIDYDQPLDPADEAMFDSMLAPLLNIYNFVKYAASVVAVLIGVYAGVVLIISGSNVDSKEQAKSMLTYVVLGLAVIWMAPFLVEFVVA